MTRSLTVSDSTFARLQTFAQPLVDTPDSVLERIMNAASQPRREEDAGGIRADGPEVKTPPATGRREMAGWIIQHLRTTSRPTKSSEIQQHIEATHTGDLGARDREKLPSGSARWHNTMKKAMEVLKREGAIIQGATRGTWTLGEKMPGGQDDAGRQDDAGGETKRRNPSGETGPEETPGDRLPKRTTPQEDYREPALQYLHRNGEPVPSTDIANHIRHVMADQFTQDDLIPSPQGGLNWRRTLDQEMQQLAQEGLAQGGLAQGENSTNTWRITPEGTEHLAMLEEMWQLPTGKD